MSRTNRDQDGLRVTIKRYSQNLCISQLRLAGLADVSQLLISSFVSGRLNLSPQRWGEYNELYFDL